MAPPHGNSAACEQTVSTVLAGKRLLMVPETASYQLATNDLTPGCCWHLKKLQTMPARVREPLASATLISDISR